MKYIHNDPEFAELLRIVGAERSPSIAPPLVEKDYWVTHTLWSVQRAGLECWFKGGTSLSKGFALIHRFSEDLDLKLGPGTVKSLAEVTNWKSDGAERVQERATFFRGVQRALEVSGATVALHEVEDRWRAAELRVLYPSVVGEPLQAPMRPFVVIEAGSARVVPHVERDLSSFVHDALERRGMLSGYVPNRPRGVRCVHPTVTLIEKLDAIHRRFHDAQRDAASFVRHYEDAARVIEALDRLPALPGGVAKLLVQMLAAREIRALPAPEDPCVCPSDSDRWRDVERAYSATASMFFGPRLRLDDACELLRGWLKHQ